jgi:hypothetical protein
VVKGGRSVRLTTSPSSVSRLPRKYGRPKLLTTLWASAACYRSISVFFFCVLWNKAIVTESRYYPSICVNKCRKPPKTSRWSVSRPDSNRVLPLRQAAESSLIIVCLLGLFFSTNTLCIMFRGIILRPVFI